MILPFKTDAPVYHWPIATVGIIAINVVVFLQYRFPEENPGFTIEVNSESEGIDAERLEDLIQEAKKRESKPSPGKALHLTYGAGLHPHQWVTSNFLHADFWHLLGNMAFLWVFGLVIEGKVGWYWFLPIYLGIGVTQCAVEQVVTLGMKGGGSFGASAIIFGLMAMALVWAPQNDVRVFYWIFVRIGVIDVTIRTLAVLFVLLEGFWMVTGLLNEQFIGSSLLHLMGAAIGFPLGVFLLKRGWVDCEGWDLFSLRGGRPRGATMYREKTPGAAGGEEIAEERGEERAAALKLMRGCLAQGDAEAALAVYSGAVAETGPWPLAEHDLRELIQALKKASAWSAVKPLVLEYIRRFPEKAGAMKLLLAGIYLDLEKRPAKAAEILETLGEGRLPESLDRARRGLLAKAERLRREGALEVDSGD